jgi:hypothetical protein
MAASLRVSYINEFPASKDVNTEDEKAMALEAVIRRQPVKQIEKT